MRLNNPDVKVQRTAGVSEQRTSTEKKTLSCTERLRLLLGVWMEIKAPADRERGGGGGQGAGQLRKELLSEASHSLKVPLDRVQIIHVPLESLLLF